MTECEDCGRHEGHHLGCPKTYPGDEFEWFEPENNLKDAVCAFEGCQDAPKPYGGKGPKPKYCAAHGK